MSEAKAADTAQTRYVARLVVHPTIAAAKANASGQPVNTAAPTVTGTTTVGQTLTCNPGTWTNSPTYTYTWKRNTTTVGGTTNTYLLVAGDLGATMTCIVTATNVNGSSTATSAGRGPVA